MAIYYDNDDNTLKLKCDCCNKVVSIIKNNSDYCKAHEYIKLNKWRTFKADEQWTHYCESCNRIKKYRDKNILSLKLAYSDSTTIKPVETIYKGYKFRSRTEARWAIVFDCLNIKWTYEAEGYKLTRKKKYLPDFFLPELKIFFECKGIMDDESQLKIDSFQKSGCFNLVVGYSDMTFITSMQNNKNYYELNEDKKSALLVFCRQCKRYYFTNWDSFFEETNRCPCCNKISTNPFDSVFNDWSYCGEGTIFHNSIEANIAKEAFDVAKQARFEYGENPEIEVLHFRDTKQIV